MNEFRVAVVLLCAGMAVSVTPGQSKIVPDHGRLRVQEQASTESTLYFPDYVDGGGWSIQLALSNAAGRATAAVVVAAYDQEGRPVPDLFGSETAFEIPPLGSRVLRSAGAGEIRRGWIEVQSEPPAVSGLLTYRNSESGVEVGVAPVELGDRFALFVEETSEVGAGLAVYKPDPDSRIELRIRDESGRDPLEGAIIPGQSFHQAARTLSEWFDVEGTGRGFLRDFRGLLLLRTEDESRFAPLGLRFGKGTGGLSAVPLIRDRTPETEWRTLVFPDYVEGDGWSVQLALSNVDPDASVQVWVDTFDPKYIFVPDLFDSEPEFEIPPLGSRVLRSTGAGEIRRGWIEIWTRTSGVSGSLIYGHSGTGVKVGVAPVELGNHFALFVEETGEVGTGLAVLKPDPDSRIEMRLRGESGRDPLAGGFVSWTDFHQAARTLPEWFSAEGIDRGFLEDFRGLLFLETEDGSPFAPLGLRFGKGTGALSAVPAIRIPEVGGTDIAPESPPTVTLSASPSSIARGESTTLSWSSTNAESAEMEPDIGEVAVSGTRRVSPNVTTTYRITVTGADGQTATAAVTVTMTVSDRPALRVLYEALGGSNWSHSENWLTDAPLEDWYGVEVDGRGRVTGLQMTVVIEGSKNGIGLTGEIPPEIAALSHLRVLNLAGNRLEGEIPAELGRLSDLTELNLRSNQLTGSIPAELGNLSNLMWLDLGGNQLSGPIPAELGNLSNLRGLDLFINQLSGPIPAELGNISDLFRLDLSSNRLSGPIPLRFAQLEWLDTFNFSRNQGLCAPAGAPGFVAWLKGIAYQEGPYCDLAVLESLYRAAAGDGWRNSDGWLGDGAVSEWFGVRVDSRGLVSGLDLSDNGLVGRLPGSMSRMAQLTVLRVDGNTLSGRLPESLIRLPLREFHYSDTDLCVPDAQSFRAWLDAIPSHDGTGVRCGPPSDRDLLVALYDATGGPDWARSDGWATETRLEDWYGVTVDRQGRVIDLTLPRNGLEGEIPAELGRLSSLRNLHLWNNRLTGSIPPELGRLSNLQSLGLNWNGLEGEIPPELGRLSNLQLLRLGGNGLEGEVPAELGRLSHLRRLELSRNRLTGSIPPELGRLSNLQELRLGGNGLEGEIPAELGRLSNLQRLELSNNHLAGSVSPGLCGMRSLKIMDLAHNARLSGSLPACLAALGGLEALLTGNTDLCVPSDVRLLDWLEGVWKRRVPPCSRSSWPRAYLTQAVQSREFPVSLVAGEEALLRVFVTASNWGGRRFPPVRATFYRVGTAPYVVNLPGKSAPVPAEVEEGSLSTSANVQVPGEIVQPGLEMVIEVDPDGTLGSGTGLTRRIPETGRQALAVREMPRFDLTLIPFLWRPDPDRSITDLVKAMAKDPGGHELLWATRTLLPIGEFKVTAHEAVLTDSGDRLSLLNETRVIHAMEGARGYYKGMISGRFAGGVAEQPGQSSVSAPDSFVMAHELGHNLNLGHAPCAASGALDPSFPGVGGLIGSWGYDLRDRRLVPPSEPDLMSYCYPRWISEYHFNNALRYRLLTAGGGGSSLLVATPAQSLLLWGGVDAAGVPFLEPVFVVSAPMSLPRSGGGHELVGRTGAGDELFALKFRMPEVADGDGRSSFAFVLPAPAEWAETLAGITLTGPGGSVSLDRDTDRPVTILRHPQTGQVRAILRGAGAAPPNVDAAVSALSMDPGVERLTSRGIPDPDDWTP